jgi:hypothetical protein
MTARGDRACPFEGGGQARSRTGQVVPPMRHVLSKNACTDTQPRLRRDW